MAQQKIIITCAVTGGIHTPTMSPYLPVSPEKIAEEAIHAAKAGAAAVHIHARNPENGMPSADLNLYRQIIEDRVNGLGVSEAVVQVAGDRRIERSVVEAYDDGFARGPDTRVDD